MGTMGTWTPPRIARANRQSLRKFAPLAAAVLLAVGSLMAIDFDESLYGDYDHDGRRRRLLSGSAQEQISTAGLTREQIEAQRSLVCKNRGESESAATIFAGAEPPAPFEGCFVSAIFGLSSSLSDKPLDASSLRSQYPNYAFLMFTNLVDLEAKGWETFLYFDASKRRMITMSRWPKFLAWKEEYVRKYCPIVFYLDGSQKPASGVERFDREKKLILQTEVGFAQNMQHPLTREMSDIVRYKKDTRAHMDATLEWMQNQSDFETWEEPRRVYYNCHIAYDPNSPSFQKASQYFWDVYAKEELSWRDQPLWAYTLHHLSIKPQPFTNPERFRKLFAPDFGRFGGRKGSHKYDVETDGEVELFLSSVCAKKKDIDDGSWTTCPTSSGAARKVLPNVKEAARHGPPVRKIGRVPLLYVVTPLSEPASTTEHLLERFGEVVGPVKNAVPEAIASGRINERWMQKPAHARSLLREWDASLVFSVVRNPWTRFCSVYDYCKRDDQRIDEDVEAYPSFLDASKNPTVLARHCRRSPSHWMPFLPHLIDEDADGGVYYDCLLRQEHMDQDWGEFRTHVNATIGYDVGSLPGHMNVRGERQLKRGPCQEYYEDNPEALGYVQEFYRGDIEHFGYSYPYL